MVISVLVFAIVWSSVLAVWATSGTEAQLLIWAVHVLQSRKFFFDSDQNEAYIHSWFNRKYVFTLCPFWSQVELFERCLSNMLPHNLSEKQMKRFCSVLSETFLIIPIDGPHADLLLLLSFLQTLVFFCHPTVFLGVCVAVHDTTLSYLWLWLPGYWNNLVSPAYYSWHRSSQWSAFKVGLFSGWENRTWKFSFCVTFNLWIIMLVWLFRSCHVSLL